MVCTGVLSQAAMVAVAPLFFFIFLGAVLKKPFFCYEGQKFKRAIIGGVAFVCLIRGLNAIFNNNEGSVLA